jgi:hypothetical protein
MAGIFERVKQTATDRVPSHFLWAAFVFKNKGTYTSQQLLDSLNIGLQTPLAGAELTDLTNIVNAMAAAGSLTNRMDYINTLGAAAIAVEAGRMAEAQFRSILGIA